MKDLESQAAKREAQLAERMEALMQSPEVQEFAWIMVEIRKMTQEKAMKNVVNDIDPEAA